MQTCRGAHLSRGSALASSTARKRASALRVPCLRGSATAQAITDATWQQFVERVSGEWEGTTASFTLTGAPLPLPDYYVPQAFRDWGVELLDWQSQCSCDISTDGGIKVSTKRLLPTVGCEADAIAFKEDLQTALNSRDQQDNPILADGSYFAGPASFSPDDSALKLEFVLPTSPESAEGPARTRVRVVIHLTQYSPHNMSPEKIDLHRERWDGAYNPNLQLSGCGGGMSGFAKGEKASVSDARSEGWRLLQGGSWQWSEEQQKLRKSDKCDVGVLPASAIGLPLQSCVAVESSGSNIVAHVAVQLNERLRRHASASYNSGRLAGVALATEVCE